MTKTIEYTPPYVFWNDTKQDLHCDESGQIYLFWGDFLSVTKNLDKLEHLRTCRSLPNLVTIQVNPSFVKHDVTFTENVHS